MNETLEFIKAVFPYLVALVLGVLAFLLVRRAGGHDRERTQRTRELVEDSRRTAENIERRNSEAQQSAERATDGIDEAQDRIEHGLELIEEIRKRNKT